MSEEVTRHILIHVPRTAGTSIRAALAQMYQPSERAFVYDPEEVPGARPPGWLETASPQAREHLRLVMGRVPFGLHDHLPGRVRYLTILRNPLDRVVSLWAAQDAATRLPIRDWLETEPDGVDNGMTRLVAGRTGLSFGVCPDDLLAEAIEHLDAHFDAVLMRGRISAARTALAEVTGRRVPAIGRLNVSPTRPRVADLEPSVLARVSELNQLDMKLFQAAVQLAEVGRFARSVVVQTAPPRQTSRRLVSRSVSRTVLGDRTLIFMHIAKTGGTSLRAALADAYGKDERAFVYDPADLRGAVSLEGFQELPEARRAQLRLVMGHFGYGIHKALGRPFRYVTVLRDPTDRVVSLYYHYRHLRGLRLGGRAREEQALLRRTNMSLEEWVFGQQRLAVDNGMTRNIAGRPHVRFGQCSDDLLDEALEHIERHFVALLVTDELEAGQELLEAITGRDFESVRHHNVNRKRLRVDELDPAVVDRIRELNRLDVQLYEWARERFRRASEGGVTVP